MPWRGVGVLKGYSIFSLSDKEDGCSCVCVWRGSSKQKDQSPRLKGACLLKGTFRARLRINISSTGIIMVSKCCYTSIPNSHQTLQCHKQINCVPFCCSLHFPNLSLSKRFFPNTTFPISLWHLSIIDSESAQSVA